MRARNLLEAVPRAAVALLEHVRTRLLIRLNDFLEQPAMTQRSPVDVSSKGVAWGQTLIDEAPARTSLSSVRQAG